MKTKRFIIVLIIVAFAASLVYGGGGELNGIQTLTARLTSTRAGYLDALGLASGKKVPNGTDDWTSTRAGKLDRLPASGTVPITTQVPDPAHFTNARGDKLDYLDAAISTRRQDKGQTAMIASFTTTGFNTYQTVLNLSGAGQLSSITWRIATATNNLIDLRITVDGGAAQSMGAKPGMVVANQNGEDRGTLVFSTRFKTSLLVEVKSVGAEAIQVFYGLDI